MTDTDLIQERGTCAFCEMESEYVLSVSDPAPEDMKVVEGSVPMPICIDHYRNLKESNLNERGSHDTEMIGE